MCLFASVYVCGCACCGAVWSFVFVRYVCVRVCVFVRVSVRVCVAYLCVRECVRA